MIDKIRTILINDGAVNTAASNGVFLGNEPQTISPPYLVITSGGGNTNDTKTGVSTLDQAQIEITAYGEFMITESGTIGSYSLMELVRTALDYYDDTVGGTTLFARADGTITTGDLSIPNKNMYSASLDFEIYEKRS